jgi:hypothetical protein
MRCSVCRHHHTADITCSVFQQKLCDVTLCGVVDTNLSGERAALPSSLYLFYPEDGYNMVLRSVGKFLPDYTASYP